LPFASGSVDVMMSNGMLLSFPFRALS
jgi:hypothetical protein